MKAEIICVGTELLLGDIVNTNAQFIARELSALGISVFNQQVVGDNPTRLREAATLAKGRSDIVIYSGGLGPTDDDLTKQTIAGVYNDDLVFNQDICDKIESFFKKSGRIMTENNRRQAYVPRKGRYLDNAHGTAPGIVFIDGEKMAILVPGVPREMEHMMEDSVVPLLKKLVNGTIRSRYVRTIGLGESDLETRIKPLIDRENPTVAVYAKEGEVQIRLTALARSPEEADALLDDTYSKLDSIIHNNIYGVDVDSIEQVLVNTLIERNQTVSTAESCTGGTLSSRITSIPGASSVFNLGVCTYSDEQKHRALNVPKDMLDTYTAVSRQVAVEMALGVKRLTGSDYAVATTGYAGPTGGTETNPVGTVYIAVADNDTVFVKRCSFSGNRQRVTHLACQSAFDILRCVMFNLPCDGLKVADVTAYAEPDDEEEEKKGGLLKKLFTGILLILLALVLAMGILKVKYKDAFKIPFIEGGKLPSVTQLFEGFKKEKDIQRVLTDRLTQDFFAPGFEKDTLKTFRKLAAQNQGLAGWIVFRSAKEEHPVFTDNTGDDIRQALRLSRSDNLSGYVFLNGMDEENSFDLTELDRVRKNSSFLMFDEEKSSNYQIFAVSTFSGQDLEELMNIRDKQEFIVQIRARSLFDIDTVVTDRNDILALTKQLDGDRYVVAFAVPGSNSMIPSVDVKTTTLYSDWYMEEKGVTNEFAADALLYAQEIYDRDNWYVSMEALTKEDEQSSSSDASSGSSGSSSSTVSQSLNSLGSSQASSSSASTSSQSSVSSAGSGSSAHQSSRSSQSSQSSQSTSRSGSRRSTSMVVTIEDDDEEILTVTMNGQVVSGPASQILAQIVAVEMTSTWHPEAIKAQAIATHSYLEFQYRRGVTAPAVSGRSGPSHNIVNNVATVSDLIMTYNGRPINASYTASVAGRTNPSSQVWGTNYPYLQSVESKYDYMTSGYEKVYTVSAERMKEILESRINVQLDIEDAANWFSVIDYTDGGYVRRMKVGNATTYTGSNGNTRSITGYYFASDIMASADMPLRSAAFDIEYENGTFTITTRGYGHGVGLSQWGAEMYARQEGWTYDQILRHYYTGVTITKK